MSTVPQKPKPSGVAYLIPVGIWILFSIVAVLLLVMGISRVDDVVDDFARVDSGTSATVDLTSSGGYRIWLEQPGADEGLAPPSTVTVTGPDGQDVQVSPYIGDLTYSLSGREGTAVYTFDAPSEGSYTITGEITDGSGGTFAIGKDNPLAEAGRGVLLMVVVGTVGFLIALVLFIVLAVKRGRSKRQIREANAAAYPPAGGYPGGGYGPPGGGYGQPAPSYGGQPGYGAPGAGGPTFGAPPPQQQGTPPPAGWSPPPPPS